MKIAMALNWGEKSFQLSFDENQVLMIGEKKADDLCIPGFGRRISLVCNRENVTLQVEKGKKNSDISVQLGRFAVIDYDERISAFFTEEMVSDLTLPLPAEGVLHIGRNATTAWDEKNEVVIVLPFVSDRHFRIVCSRGETMVEDLGSKNGLFLNGKRIRSGLWREGDVLSVCTLQMTLHQNVVFFKNVEKALVTLPAVDTRKSAPMNPIQDSRLLYSRSPRLVSAVREEEIRIERPPQKGGTPKLNWLGILVAPMLSAALMAVFVVLLGISPVMLMMSGSMAVVSAIVAVISYRIQKKKSGARGQLIDEKYRAYLSSVAGTLEDAGKRQREFLESANPDPLECLQIAQERSRRLWERLPTDGDFLSFRLGKGDVCAAVTASFQRPQVVIEENVLEEEAGGLAAGSRIIADAPILCSQAESRVLGVIGSRADALQLVRSVMTELAAAHSYRELKMVILDSGKEEDAWNWARWLPHCADDRREKRYCFSSFEQAEEKLNALEEMLGRRKNEIADRRGAESVLLPHYLFVFPSQSALQQHSIRKLLLSELDLGCSCLFIAEQMTGLPKECTRIVEVRDGQGEIACHVDGGKKRRFRMDAFSVEEADQFSRALAPVYLEAEEEMAELPDSVSFLEGYGVRRLEELRIEDRWAAAKTYQAMSVPIGALPGGDAFCFDIHEKRHGVNGVVAGMPGSGKTEMVQTWLLSMAVNFSPQDVSFILIDFKGTGMIAPFRGLPHLAGSISNLDISIDRNLRALQSEVHRREAIIDRYSDRNVRDINTLNRQYDRGAVPERLPILLVVIDEYAEFKKNFPDFGAEIDSLTSKGRALGIFVILMTQKPAGVVSAKSEDNIKFRWCLRVANYGASREMLGRPDAARIVNPGRVYVKVGEDDVYEQLQSFWSGAPYDPEAGGAAESVISLVASDGRRIPGESVPRTITSRGSESEIDAVVRCIAAHCEKAGIPSAKKVWTDRLPERLSLADILPAVFRGGAWPEERTTATAIGLLDDPASQRQYPLELDLAKSGHTIVYGAPVTGKTTLLQTYIMSAALSRRPDEVHIYVMDFGGWNMNLLKDLPHVGGIVNDSEPEKLKKLTMLLGELLQARKEALSAVGVGNIAAYRRATGRTEPDVVVIVDNIGAALKMYPELEAFFVVLTGSGANYGMFLLATALAPNAVSYRISQNMKNALALQLIEKSDYNYVVGRTEGKLPPVMGRGYAKGTPPLEFQTALPMPGDNDLEVADNIRAAAAAMKRSWTGESPAAIPELPREILYGSIRADGVCIGLSVERVQPICYDHEKQHFLLISGRDERETSGMLRMVARQLREKLGGTLCWISAGETAACGTSVAADVTLTGAAQIDDFIEKLRPELQKRQQQAQEGVQFEPIIFAVDHYCRVFREISNESAARLLAVVKLGRGLGLYLLVAGDAYELTSLVNKGEALTVSLARGEQAVALGGCLNDHGAFQTKGSYSQKNTAFGHYEGSLILGGETVNFKRMLDKGE